MAAWRSGRRGEVARVIAAPAEAAWSLLVDTERWPEWGPSIVAGARATGHRVEALAPGRCRVVFEVPWFAWPYRFVCKRALERIERVLVGLRERQ